VEKKWKARPESRHREDARATSKKHSSERICGTRRAGSYDRHVDNRLASRVCHHVQMESGSDRWVDPRLRSRFPRAVARIAVFLANKSNRWQNEVAIDGSRDLDRFADYSFEDLARERSRNFSQRSRPRRNRALLFTSLRAPQSIRKGRRERRDVSNFASNLHRGVIRGDNARIPRTLGDPTVRKSVPATDRTLSTWRVRST